MEVCYISKNGAPLAMRGEVLVTLLKVCKTSAGCVVPAQVCSE